jgi:thiol-disulfide isomerase/thioredoxin
VILEHINMRITVLVMACAHLSGTACAPRSIHNVTLPESSQVTSHDGLITVGQEIPSFAGWTLQSEPFSRDNIAANEVTIISLFATWCEPCVAGMPIIDRVASEHSAYGAVFVAVGQDKAIVEPWIADLGIRQTVVPDPYGTISQRFLGGESLSVSLPRTYLVDKGGMVRTIFVSEGRDFENALLSQLVEI